MGRTFSANCQFSDNISEGCCALLRNRVHIAHKILSKFLYFFKKQIAEVPSSLPVMIKLPVTQQPSSRDFRDDGKEDSRVVWTKERDSTCFLSFLSLRAQEWLQLTFQRDILLFGKSHRGNETTWRQRSGIQWSWVIKGRSQWYWALFTCVYYFPLL